MAGFTLSGRRLKGRTVRTRKPASTTAKRALKLAKKAMNDFHTITNLTPVTLDVIPNFTQLFIAGDLGLTTEIDYRSLNLDLEIRQDLMSQLIDDYRIMVILDRQPNRTQLTATDVFGQAQPNITMQVENVNQRRLQILFDQRGAFEQSNAVVRNMKIRRKLRFTGRSVGNSQVVTSLETNALYIMMWTTATGAQVPTVEFSHTIRAVA